MNEPIILITLIVGFIWKVCILVKKNERESTLSNPLESIEIGPRSNRRPTNSSDCREGELFVLGSCGVFDDLR